MKTTNWLLFRQRIVMVGLVAAYWISVAAAPAIVAGYIARPTAGLTSALLAVSLYCAYTGYRAWKKGWKARFILRAVVPAAILVVTSVAAAIGSWAF